MSDSSVLHSRSFYILDRGGMELLGGEEFFHYLYREAFC